MAHRFDTPKFPRPRGGARARGCAGGLLGLSFFLFGDAAAAGPNQVALSAAVASVTTGLSAIFILLAVGALIGAWALGGTLLAKVYYGLKLLNPDYFCMTACLICAVVALSIGSS